MKNSKRKIVNRMNNLSGKEWIKFQKSWFFIRSKPRTENVKQHPASFPVAIAMEFIRFFTKQGETVLDPMGGTGSTIIAASQSGRNAISIELQPKFVKIARQRLYSEGNSIFNNSLRLEIINADARKIPEMDLPEIDYVLTSPPYWDILHRSGTFCRERKNSSITNKIYSDDSRDFGNISDYDTFIEEIVDIYSKLKFILRPKAYLTIIVKNIKKKGKIYPLAWDLANELSKIYTLKDEKLWLQDNQRLAPYGIYNAWVSNVFHHYCLQFRNE